MSGLCGVVTKRNCSEILLFGTDYHSHLGSQLAGLVVKGKTFQKKIHNISQGQFKSKFGDFYQRMDGDMGIGVISDHDAQPLLIHSRFGTYAIAMAGLVENKDQLTQELFRRGSVFTETSNSGINAVELLAKIIETGNDFVEGLSNIYDMIDGSASILVLTAKGIYAARDRLGRTPLAIGENDGDYMVASESSAFPNLDFRFSKELGPGEIIFLHRDGYQVLREPGDDMQICAFLWIYTGYPASSYESINVEKVRERCGGCLAKHDNVEADLVAGVPDSGVGHGLGYAKHSNIPYRRVLVKYTPGYGRSYIPPSQNIRDQMARMKLLPISEVIRGNRIVLCEDSIVRGTQLKNHTIQKLMDAGAREVHMRPSCPPLMFPCKFALSTRELDELIARKAIYSLEGDNSKNLEKYLDPDSDHYRRMVAWIADHLKVTTLQYQRLDDMVEAIGLPKEKLCLYCWTGESYSYKDKTPRKK